MMWKDAPTACPIPNCVDCELNATDCPPESRLWPTDRVCWVRGETGSCEHTTKIMDDIRTRRSK